MQVERGKETEWILAESISVCLRIYDWIETVFKYVYESYELLVMNTVCCWDAAKIYGTPYWTEYVLNTSKTICLLEEPKAFVAKQLKIDESVVSTLSM